MKGENPNELERDASAAARVRLADVFSPYRIQIDVTVSSVKRLLETISEQFAKIDSQVMTKDSIFRALVKRERLGSTCVGKGVALPHGRMDGLEEPVGAIIRLAPPLDMEAIDDQPVHIACGLLVPTDSADRHIAILRKLAQGFEQFGLYRQFMEAQNSAEIYSKLSALDSAG